MEKINLVKSETPKLENKEQEAPKFEFKDLAEVEQYLDWKEAVPAEVRRLVEGAMLDKQVEASQTELALCDKFLDSLGQSLRQKGLSGVNISDPKIQNLLAPLEKVETKGGFLNVFESLTNPATSWSLKRQIYETQIKAALDWLVDQDLNKLAEQSQTESEEGDEQEKGSDQAPPSSEDVKSSMEGKTEKQEGEPNAFFRVKPFYGGYYKQLVFNKFDLQDLRWGKQESSYQPAETIALDTLKTRIIQGKVNGKAPLSLPLPCGWAPDVSSLQTDAPNGAEISINQDGLYYLNLNDQGVFDYQLKIGPKQAQTADSKLSEAEVSGQLPEELSVKIAELKKSRQPKMKQLRELVKFIRNSLTYSNSNEAWQKYASQPAEFFARLWDGKEADCFVANTLAVRALSEIDNRVNFVGGYYVKDKNKEGEAIMHAGNGHAWLEVWDELSRRAVRLDATPKGDPNLDEQEQEQDLDGESGEGDFGESEDELMSEDEAKKKIEELKKGQGAKEKRQAAPADLEKARFAELAECSQGQAQEFFDALERVRQIKDAQGQSISEQMKNEWKKIIVERKTETTDYRGPVRMDEGDRLEDPVSARIDIRSHEFNPTGFEKQETVEKVEMDFGGINIFFSFDLSGSMNEADGASGRRKADVQRDVALLFVDSLMQCAYVSRQQGDGTELLPIKLMATVASSKGETKLNLTDRWTPKEQWALYASLNKLAGGSTPTHQTLQLIEREFDQEMTAVKKKKIPKEKWPLNYVAEISDGDPDDFAQTEKLHQILKDKGAVVRSYAIGGASASADAAEPLSSFEQLPQILSKDLIEKFKQLHPRRIKQ
ncbi:MAG: transglutaminase domain-containing protein [Candidatus Falkowbacteria bacterium]